MGAKLTPNIILAGTRLTLKTDNTLALNEHPRIAGPRKYRYHASRISAEWYAFTNYPWGRGLISFEPEERSLPLGFRLILDTRTPESFAPPTGLPTGLPKPAGFT